MVSGDKASRNLTLGATRMWAVNFNALGKDPAVPIGEEAGWVITPVWTQKLRNTYIRRCQTDEICEDLTPHTDFMYVLYLYLFMM
jgi:hypothetical protein